MRRTTKLETKERLCHSLGNTAGRNYFEGIPVMLIGNGLAILMYRQEEGELELFDDLTVNLPGGYGLKTAGGICKR